MNFELRPPRKQSSNSELLNDLRRVAHLLDKSTLRQKEYRANGIYSPRTLVDRFGTWVEALARAGLGSSEALPLTEAELIDDLRSVAKALDVLSVTQKDYEVFGKYSRGPFERVFSNWRDALNKAGLAASENYHKRVSNEMLFENLEHVWIQLGRQPAYLEMERPISAHSITTYERRFGSWRGALEAFVVHMNEPTVDSPAQLHPIQTSEPALSFTRRNAVRRTPRTPNNRLRFIVMRRDNFSCRSCGNSPAIKPGVLLHIDHVMAWVKGGETTLENLQTLCERCNLGKSTLDSTVMTIKNEISGPTNSLES